MYNQLTPGQEERLSLLKQQAQKIIETVDNIGQFGYNTFTPYMSGPDNRGKLEAALGDLNAVIVEMVKQMDIDDSEILAHAYRRQQRIEEVRAHH